ncbi:MAG TPA: MATE family efflux transporter, partial [Anaerolineae bacterium]|nr:MATE family efflux transporter [Anaerolineae bacterium]
KTALPVVLTEVAWSLGITTYAIIYARISTESIAAVNIVITIERMAFVVFLAMANASAIMIGNRIGAGDIEQAVLYAKRFLILGLLGSIPIGLLEVSAGIPFLRVYQISETVTDYATILLILAALVLPFKVSALMLFVGVLRSGGDTRFSMFVDGGTIWLVGVPLAWLGAFVLGLPVYWVYLMVVTEELVKVSIALRRFLKGAWIHHLAEPEPVRVG